MKLLQKKHWDALYKMAEKKWHWVVKEMAFVPAKVDYIYCFLEFNSNGDIELEHSYKNNVLNRTFRKDAYTAQALSELQWGLLRVGYDVFIKYKDNYK